MIIKKQVYQQFSILSDKTKGSTLGELFKNKYCTYRISHVIEAFKMFDVFKRNFDNIIGTEFHKPVILDLKYEH